jgi:hypothetical protein
LTVELKEIFVSMTEIGKEYFLKFLSRRVEEYGQETFYHEKNSTGLALNLLNHAHIFTVYLVTKDFQ